MLDPDFQSIDETSKVNAKVCFVVDNKTTY
jgi:hypothetical protein